MIKRQLKISLLILFFSNILFSAYGEVIKQIDIIGNERISDETIIMFSKINIDDDVNYIKINTALKDLYNTNFFDNVVVKIDTGILTIKVDEAPIINDITFTGVKAKKYLKQIEKNLILKRRYSYNQFLLKEELKSIKTILKDYGFYFAKVDPFIETLDNNQININYKIDLGNKAKIKKISFIGDKIFKDRKLRSLIISEEYKFWKFISGKKFLQESMIAIDNRLLKNFYLNKGYYNVKVNTSFAKLINDDEFELIFNIQPSNKIYFDKLEIIFPEDYDKENYLDLNNLLNNLKNKPYSLNAVSKILNEIDYITINEEFKSVKASTKEKIIDNKLNISFNIEETEKYFIEKINIFGNNVTRETVIRNQLIIDEGDPYNEILAKKSENNIKSLNFFKSVKTETVDGADENSKIINIKVEEQATGEISAGAGLGTSGGTVAFGVKENNYLGKGLAVEANATVTAETFKGLFSVTNPNYKNTDKSIFVNLQAIEIDQLKNFGYKTNKTGFSIGTNFEYLKDFNLGLATSSFIEKIETDSTASERQKKQKGNYWDTFVKFNFDYDKRNQKFKTSDGFRSNYNLDLPLISDTNTLTNRYKYKYYTELYPDNISTMSILLKSAHSLSGDDIKLTERLSIPSNSLRGFERGKVGPKDGNDFIGGNYVTSINFSTTLPQIFQNFQNVDASLFVDTANIWGVDYDSSLNESGKLRSSIGIGVDWFTVIGPLNFSLTEVITKESTDIEESFRFNLGTTF